jgi:hypothetical protein
MAQLTEPVKLAITQALACFDTPTQVADFVKEEFGIVITRQQASQYDATKTTGKSMSKKLRAVFEATRAAFLESTADIPIAQQSYRLRVLQRMLTKAEKLGNMAMVSQLLEQAAKESGGAFTNKRELTGKDGKPLMPQPAGPLPADPIEAAAVYQQYMQGG